MKLIVNGEARDLTNATTIADVLNELEFNVEVVAVALNGDFVTRTQYRDTRVKENDSLEIVSPIAGG